MKAGDKVRYCKAGAIGWESEDWASTDGLVLGENYTVIASDMNHGQPFVRVKEGKIRYDIHPDHFELITNHDPKTLTEAVNLGKVYGIDTAQTIMAVAVSKAIEQNIDKYTVQMAGFVSDVWFHFNQECAAYKSQLNKPVTEEEKKQILEP